jgi:hypothetical protein
MPLPVSRIVQPWIEVPFMGVIQPGQQGIQLAADSQVVIVLSDIEVEAGLPAYGDELDPIREPLQIPVE